MPPPLALPKRGRVDAERFTKLHAQGMNDRQIAEELGLETSGASWWRRKLGLAPNGRGLKPQTASAADPSAAMTFRDIERWLREVNVTVDIIEPGKRWRLNNTTSVEAKQLLAVANARRARVGQPPFELAT